MTNHKFSEFQTPIGHRLDRHIQGHTVKHLQLNLTLASNADGVTVVPILLNSCSAYELGETLIAAAEYLSENSRQPLIDKVEATDET